MNKNLAQVRPKSSYSIFTGIFEVDNKSKFKSQLTDQFVEWNFKVPHYKGENILKDLRQVYYEPYICALFDEDRIQRFTHKSKNWEPLTIEELFNSDTENAKEILQRIPSDIRELSVRISFLDIYLFPFDFVFCVFKIDYAEASLGHLPFLNYLFREFTSLDALEWITSKIPFYNTVSLQKKGNKLKTYTVIEHDLDLNKEEEFHLLYDIGTCSEIGSAVHQGSKKFLYPSEEYYNTLITENKISVFENWSALCLFDSVTFIHKQPLNIYTFENAYYNLIYVGSLFLKFLLHRVNTDFSNNISMKKAQELEKRFINIDRIYNLRYISFNFLPQLVYEQFRKGLNIDEELNVLADRIEHYNDKERELREEEESRNEKKVNQILTIIAILSVFDAIATAAQWIFNLINFKKIGNPFLIINIIISILVAVIILYVIKGKKNNKTNS